MYRQSPHIHVHAWGRFNNHTAYSLYRIIVTATSVMDLMKMGNVVPRGGIEPTSLPFRASVLTITPCRFPFMSPLCPCLPVYAAPCLRGQCSQLHLLGFASEPFIHIKFIFINLYLYKCPRYTYYNYLTTPPD